MVRKLLFASVLSAIGACTYGPESDVERVSSATTSQPVRSRDAITDMGYVDAQLIACGLVQEIPPRPHYDDYLVEQYTIGFEYGLRLIEENPSFCAVVRALMKKEIVV